MDPDKINAFFFILFLVFRGIGSFIASLKVFQDKGKQMLVTSLAAAFGLLIMFG
jgi:hypothetical protein